MCFGSRMCMMCICVISLVILIGLVFGFGVFRNGFHKLKETLHNGDPAVAAIDGKTPFLGFTVPPPF